MVPSAHPKLRRSPLAAWSLELLAGEIKESVLTVDLMDASGCRAGSESWSFRRWAAAAASWASTIDSAVPYIRNIAVPDRLLRECSHLSPFAGARAPTLFLGCRSSRTKLHADALPN
eukprot:2125284-Prymnesium_polylepis.1